MLNFRSFEIIAVLKEDLSINDRDYINSIIRTLILKYKLIIDDRGIIYKEQQVQYDDFIPCTSFSLELFEYKTILIF